MDQSVRDFLRWVVLDGTEKEASERALDLLLADASRADTSKTVALTGNGKTLYVTVDALEALKAILAAAAPGVNKIKAIKYLRTIHPPTAQDLAENKVSTVELKAAKEMVESVMQRYVL